ncbi:hypothetical protein [Sphingobacterium detergens]
MLKIDNSIVSTIQGGVAKDHRGEIRFVNDFDMSLVKRFYVIKNNDIELVRGWRGHKIEQRWFYVLSGAFSLHLIHIDNWEKPSIDLGIEHMFINSSEMTLLNVPAGYATAFRALEANSELLVYADYELAHAKFDDYTWPLEYFSNFV